MTRSRPRLRYLSSPDRTSPRGCQGITHTDQCGYPDPRQGDVWNGPGSETLDLPHCAGFGAIDSSRKGPRGPSHTGEI